jgi:hypothetical protein
MNYHIFEFLKCAEIPKASGLNLTIEKICANAELKASEAFGNEWQNSSLFLIDF